jgi:hypothetical protein
MDYSPHIYDSLPYLHDDSVDCDPVSPIHSHYLFLVLAVDLLLFARSAFIRFAP